MRVSDQQQLKAYRYLTGEHIHSRSGQRHAKRAFAVVELSLEDLYSVLPKQPNFPFIYLEYLIFRKVFYLAV